MLITAVTIPRTVLIVAGVNVPASAVVHVAKRENTVPVQLPALVLALVDIPIAISLFPLPVLAVVLKLALVEVTLRVRVFPDPVFFTVLEITRVPAAGLAARVDREDPETVKEIPAEFPSVSAAVSQL